MTGEKFKMKSAIASNDARADVAARSFWVKGKVVYAHVRVFTPLAKSHKNLTLEAVHKKNENEKKRNYNERILNVDHGSFTPLVFSCYGGMSRECSRFYSHAAELIAEKRKISGVSGWMKTRDDDRYIPLDPYHPPPPSSFFYVGIEPDIAIYYRTIGYCYAKQ